MIAVWGADGRGRVRTLTAPVVIAVLTGWTRAEAAAETGLMDFTCGMPRIKDTIYELTRIATARACVTHPTNVHRAAHEISELIDPFPGCETPEGLKLKPMFGDIDGVFYTDLPAQRQRRDSLSCTYRSTW